MLDVNATKASEFTQVATVERRLKPCCDMFAPQSIPVMTAQSCPIIAVMWRKRALAAAPFRWEPTTPSQPSTVAATARCRFACARRFPENYPLGWIRAERRVEASRLMRTRRRRAETPSPQGAQPRLFDLVQNGWAGLHVRQEKSTVLRCI